MTDTHLKSMHWKTHDEHGVTPIERSLQDLLSARRKLRIVTVLLPVVAAVAFALGFLVVHR